MKFVRWFLGCIILFFNFVFTPRAIKREGLKIETRDAKNNQQFRQELLEQGGKIKVPCLRIEKNGQVEWLYESNDIIAYLNKVAA